MYFILDEILSGIGKCVTVLNYSIRIKGLQAGNTCFYEKKRISAKNRGRCFQKSTFFHAFFRETSLTNDTTGLHYGINNENDTFVIHPVLRIES